jgi:hypothetical protein
MVSLCDQETQNTNYEVSNGLRIIASHNGNNLHYSWKEKGEKRAQELLINFTVSPQMLQVLKTGLLKCKHQDLMNNGM